MAKEVLQNSLVEGSQENAFNQYILLNIMKGEKDTHTHTQNSHALLIHRYGLPRVGVHTKHCNEETDQSPSRVMPSERSTVTKWRKVRRGSCSAGYIALGPWAGVWDVGL